MERRIKGDVKPTRSNSSNRWMHEHVTDPFVQQAKKLGYRSRAAFKIIEIDEKYKLFRRGMTVVDLGAAPGGWSQIAAPKVGADGAPAKAASTGSAAGTSRKGAGRVIAIDLLEMPGLPGVEFLQADFTTQEGLAAVVNALAGGGARGTASGKVGLVMSDMAPNISGIGVSDQAKSMYLCEIALEFAVRFLESDGAFVVKTFQGAGFPEFLKEMRASFREVKTIKPKASRDRSSEMYLVGKGLRQAGG
jgi:23S rRNA (uridine2552-2'-O)-methyltransferase